MPYQFKTSHFVVPQAIEVDSTAQALPLGTRIRAQDPAHGEGEFIYLKGVASTIVGSVVTYNADDWTTALLAANAIGPVAVAMSPCVAGEFGWYQIFGKAIVDAGTVADNGHVYATATPGEVDDALVAGDRIKNARFASGNAAGVAECEIAYPFMDDALAA